MAAIPPKKTSTPSTAGSVRKGALNATTPSDTPSRSPTRTATTTATQPPMNRTRSVRTGNPPSARAAARKPATDSADDDAKAELQAKLEELQEQLRKAEDDATNAHEKATLLQVKLDKAIKDQGQLEEHVHEHLERINDLEVEKKESLRAKREMEQIFESERIAVMKEKEDMQTREDELRSSLKRLKETLSQKEQRGPEDDGRPGLQRNSASRKSMPPSPGAELGQFAPSGSLDRSDSRSSSKLVMQKDKIIEELRLELAEAQIRLVEVEHSGGGHMTKLQKEMYDVKMQNARLMEENESFQLLLSEKTLNGDFTNNELFRPSSKAGSSPPATRQGGTLADELEATEERQDITEEHRKLQAEANTLKDQNKALTLYINNIVSRLLQHDQFEHILDKTPDLFSRQTLAGSQAGDRDKELPPPPPEKDEPQGFLQRARSVLGARPARPQSQLIEGENITPSLHTNPQTAPQIPLARSGSTRHGHRRANSDWAAANVVNNMYRGPTGGAIASPVSPGLASPVARAGGFFNTPQPLSSGMPPRIPSGTIPTIPETGVDEELKDGPQQRDSKLAQSRDSDASIPDATAGGEPHSNPSSPPRSLTSNDRASVTTGPSVMVGSKMRPLRLVQENHISDDDVARKAGNRASWFGFLNKGA